jgi:hypothetical protein
MKKTLISLVTILALGTSVYAESYPAYGPNSYKAITEGYTGKDKGNSFKPEKGIYFGLAYSYVKDDGDVDYQGQTYSGDITGNAATLAIGYNFHENFALEARYYYIVGDLSYDIAGFSGDLDVDVSSISLFFKPQYNIKNFNFYALIGYGQVEAESLSENDFQWGLGASYYINPTTSIFMDYTSLYNEDANLYGISASDNIYALTFGVTFQIPNQ